VLRKPLVKSAASLVVLGALSLPVQAQLQPPAPPQIWTRPVYPTNKPAKKSAVVKKRPTLKKPVDRSFEFNASSSSAQFSRIEAPIREEQRRFQQAYTQSRCRGVCFAPAPGSSIPLNRDTSSGGPSGIAIEARTEF
jgi:hypothetical protein